jgi:translation initiation factor IF-1
MGKQTAASRHATENRGKIYIYLVDHAWNIKVSGKLSIVRLNAPDVVRVAFHEIDDELVRLRLYGE